MKYIPKTLPVLELTVPDVYHKRVMSVIEAYESDRLSKVLPERPHLENIGVIASINALSKALRGKKSEVAKKYDILYLTLLTKEVEHDRNAIESEDVRSGQFEQELIDLINRVKAAPEPTYFD